MFFEAISASLLVLIVNLIDLFTVSVAILVEGKHGKIYNKCMVKVGSLMLYTMQEPCTRLPDVISVTLSILEYMYMRRVTRKSLPKTSEVHRRPRRSMCH